MKENNKAKEHILAGKKTKYDEKKHIGLLYDIYSTGEDAAAYCAEALICRRTFYYWLKTHHEFKAAYEIVINMAERHWRKLPLNDNTINHQYWYMIMKNCFDYGKPRFVVKDGQGHTPLEAIHAIFTAIGNSELTIQEASQLASLAATQANIENGTTEDKSDNIRIMTNDEIKERLAIVDEGIAKLTNK